MGFVNETVHSYVLAARELQFESCKARCARLVAEFAGATHGAEPEQFDLWR
jgi:hypothetical protein